MTVDDIKQTMLGFYGQDLVIFSCMDNKAMADKLLSFASHYSKMADSDLTYEALLYMAALRLRNHV